MLHTQEKGVHLTIINHRPTHHNKVQRKWLQQFSIEIPLASLAQLHFILPIYQEPTCGL